MIREAAGSFRRLYAENTALWWESLFSSQPKKDGFMLFGPSSYLFSAGGARFLVDPCFRDPDWGEPLSGRITADLETLNGIILTHGDRDHAGGLDHLLERIDTDLILVPSTSAMDVPGQRVIEVAEDLTITAGSGKITVFGPTFSLESNENSLCILFEGEKCAILVTGDRSRTGELLLLRSGNLPDVDLLIAGHHGSKNSTSEELLDAVSPETVFISVGKDNSYGHPSGETLKRLMDHGCRVYRTDIMGNLIFRR